MFWLQMYGFWMICLIPTSPTSLLVHALQNLGLSEKKLGSQTSKITVKKKQQAKNKSHLQGQFRTSVLQPFLEWSQTHIL